MTIYVQRGKLSLSYDAEAYLRDRTAYFGSETNYQTCLQDGRAELDDKSQRLRKIVDPETGRKRALEAQGVAWGEAQDIYFAWVRRGYIRQLGANTNVADILRAGSSPALAAKLQQVRVDYGKEFRSGGFNPRPMKHPSGLRFGTLSDHALGNAIDIESSNNAQIPPTEWGHICDFTGLRLEADTRKTKWRSDPQGLHTAVRQISDTFVAKLREQMDAQKASDATMDDAKALAAAVAADRPLKSLTLPWVNRWRNGFFSLPWALVKELHDEGFTWGAVFPTVDLHHFEL